MQKFEASDFFFFLIVKVNLIHFAAAEDHSEFVSLFRTYKTFSDNVKFSFALIYLLNTFFSGGRKAEGKSALVQVAAIAASPPKRTADV